MFSSPASTSPPGCSAWLPSAAQEVEVNLVHADAQQLLFGDASDTVVCTLALCAVPDQSAVVAEMHRVLVPGGRLLLVDHVEYARIPMKWFEPLRTRHRSSAATA